MNRSEMKSYQDWEEMERARARRETERRMEARKIRQEQFKENYGIEPQIIVNLTTDDLLKMPFEKTKEILEKAIQTINQLSEDVTNRNEGVDICRCIPFGKHIGRTVWEIINTEPSYALWMHDNTDFKLTDYEIKLSQYVRVNNPLKEMLVDTHKNYIL